MMPAVVALKDDCVTAEDVRRKAVEVARRRASLRAIPVKQMQAQIRHIPAAPVQKAEINVTVHFGYPMLEVENYKSFQFTIIQKACCRAGGVTMGEMKSRLRRNNAVRARQIAILLCKMLGPEDLSMPMIARIFAGRDHTTIHYALQKLEPVREAVERRVASGSPLTEYVSAAFDAWDQIIEPKRVATIAAARKRAREMPRTDENRWVAK